MPCAPSGGAVCKSGALGVQQFECVADQSDSKRQAELVQALNSNRSRTLGTGQVVLQAAECTPARGWSVLSFGMGMAALAAAALAVVRWRSEQLARLPM